MIDTYLQQASQSSVTLWEDNAGGLWLVDKARDTAFDASLFDSFFPDAEALYDDRFESDGGSYPYTEIIEQWPETKLVAEYDGSTVKLYPNAMGYSAKQYCGLQ